MIHILYIPSYTSKFRVIPPQYTTLFSCGKDTAHKRLSGNYPRPGSYNLTTMYREGYRVLLTLLQFFATKFLFLALHLESGCFPRPLTAREEAAAFSALRAGDAAAREKLIRHNLRLVAHIVKKYYALPGDQEDLVSIGTIGLMKAVDTFDATRKARFSTYASRCIENAMVIFLRSNEKARLQATICGSADGLSLWNHSVSIILIFALTYMAFRKTRSRSSNVAFHAGCSENTVCST